MHVPYDIAGNMLSLVATQCEKCQYTTVGICFYKILVRLLLTNVFCSFIFYILYTAFLFPVNIKN